LTSPKGFSFHKILWLCKDVTFWTNLIEILRTRQIYDNSVWKFAWKYQTDMQAMKEYLNKAGNLTPSFPFKSKLFDTLDMVEPGSTFSKMLEYNPMINARAHKIG
jgi:hypothetical protein